MSEAAKDAEVALKSLSTRHGEREALLRGTFSGVEIFLVNNFK